MGDLTKNLSRSEFACKCSCGFDTVDIELAPCIQECVDYFQKKNPKYNIRVNINSGARCAAHNEKIGGSKNSEHVKAKAADIVIYDEMYRKDITASEVADYFEAKYPNSHGIGRYNGRTHIDVRSTKARWIV